MKKTATQLVRSIFMKLSVGPNDAKRMGAINRQVNPRQLEPNPYDNAPIQSGGGGSLSQLAAMQPPSRGFNRRLTERDGQQQYSGSSWGAPQKQVPIQTANKGTLQAAADSMRRSNTTPVPQQTAPQQGALGNFSTQNPYTRVDARETRNWQAPPGQGQQALGLQIMEGANDPRKRTGVRGMSTTTTPYSGRENPNVWAKGYGPSRPKAVHGGKPTTPSSSGSAGAGALAAGTTRKGAPTAVGPASTMETENWGGGGAGSSVSDYFSHLYNPQAQLAEARSRTP